MKLALDIMGFDNSPSEAINAARRFTKTKNDVTIILVGDQKIINEAKKPNDKFEYIFTTQEVNQGDNPMASMRKTDSSLAKAIKAVADGIADGVLSASSTASFVLMCFASIKTLPGINRPAFMPWIPTINGKGMLMVDVGANKECSGHDIYQFAQMATIYSEEVQKIKNPRVGLINIGTEVGKGFKFHDEANTDLLNDKNINYVGFIETRDILVEDVDIAVCDGYTGNITLKTMEGSLKSIQKLMKKEFKKPWNIIGALFSMGVIKKIKKTFDYKNNAGAIVLGLNKPAVKTHGSADEQQFFSSLEILYNMVKQDVVSKIKQQIK